MTLGQMIATHTFDDYESDDDPVSPAQLDLPPHFFLNDHQTMEDTEMYPNANVSDPECAHCFRVETRCECWEFMPNTPVPVPSIPIRCVMNWPVQAKLTSGTGAVVFLLQHTRHMSTGPGTVSSTGRQMVARISQLRTKLNHSQFRRDIHARYILNKQCPNLRITALVDAFICHRNDTSYGVSVTERYENNLIGHLMTLPTNQQRVEFVKTANIKICTLVQKMHKCGIYHQDLHPGNILVRPSHTGLDFALTDFEGAGGKIFNDPDRIVDAYTHQDERSIHASIVEMECLCEYLNNQTSKIDMNLLHRFGIDLHTTQLIRIQSSRDQSNQALISI
jgi:hypothetical protein